MSKYILKLRFILPIIVIALIFGVFESALAQSTEMSPISPERARESNYLSGENRLETGVVDGFTGNLTVTNRDVYIIGAGGNPIEVYRGYDGSRIREKIWYGILSSAIFTPLYPESEEVALGIGGWSLMAAPILTIERNGRSDPSVVENIYATDKLDSVCIGSLLYYVTYTIVFPGGRRERFFLTGAHEAKSFSGWRLTCSGFGGLHVLSSPSGDSYELGSRSTKTSLFYASSPNDDPPLLSVYKSTALVFSATKKMDRNGNWLKYSYANYQAKVNSSGGETELRPFIDSISSSDGRKIKFNYQMIAGAARLSNITASTGPVWSYGYNSDGQLTSYTDPVGRAWQYQYNPVVNYTYPFKSLFSTPPRHPLPEFATSKHLKSITLPTGGVVTYEYKPSEVWGHYEIYGPSVSYYERDLALADWRVEVSKKMASNGGSWTYKYIRAKIKGEYDVVTIDGVEGTLTNKYIGVGYFSDAARWQKLLGVPVFSDSYQTMPVVLGAWKVGSLVESSQGGQTTYFEWTPLEFNCNGSQIINSIVQIVDALYPSKCIYRPLLSKTTVVRNGASYVTSYGGFDAYGNPTTVTETGPNGGSRVTTIQYLNDSSKWIIGLKTKESFSGGLVGRTFDTNGNLLSETKDGISTVLTYDPQGNVASKKSSRGYTTTYSGYTFGIPSVEQQPEGITIYRTVDGSGNITSEKNGEGNITSRTYDAIGRVASVIPPLGERTSISYSANSKVVSRGGSVETTQYDAFGWPSSVTLGAITRTFTYDPLGRKTFESNPGATIGTSYQYDILNRVTRIGNADGTAQTRSYGAGSMSVTDERSKVTTYAYRAYGDPDQQFLMSITAPDASANVSIARNTKDLVTSIVQGGLARSYGYNSNYYLTSVTNPETGATVYGRDAAGNMTSRTVGASGTSTYTYDGQNRLTTVTYPGTTPSVTKTYSKTHKLKTVVSSAASRSYVYDANDNLTSESVVADGITLTMGYGYNTLDQLASVTYPYSRRSVTFSPDALGRPTVVSGYVNSVTYWPSGQIKQLNYANGTVSTYGQNNRLWPSSFATQLSASYYNNASYTYDGVGNLTAIADTADSSYNRTLTYDNISRLVAATGSWGSGTITYSGVGNISSQVFGVNSLYYTYDSQNRLASLTGARAGSYSYDAYGDFLTVPGATYTWDGVPNLRCVSCGTANEVANVYDGLNQRVSVTKGGVKTYEVYGSHGNLLAEFTPSQGNRLVEYIYLGGKRVAQRQTSQ